MPTATLTQLSAPFTSEDGRQAQFSLVLNDPPDSTVTFSVTTSDAEIGVPDLTELIFTPENYGQPQVVTVTGVDDSGPNAFGGAKDYQIVIGEPESLDDRFLGINVAPVELTNLDNEVGFEIVNVADTTQTSGWAIDETEPLVLGVTLIDRPYEDATIAFTLFLNGSPAVRDLSFVPVTGTEAGTTSTELTFTPENYDQQQTITVYPIPDDNTADPGKVFELAIGASGDIAYQNRIAALVQGEDLPYRIQNIDPDSTEIIVSPDPLRVCEGRNLVATVQVSQDPTLPVDVEFSSPSENLEIVGGNMRLESGSRAQAFTIKALPGRAHMPEYDVTMTVDTEDVIFGILVGTSTVKVIIPDASPDGGGAIAQYCQNGQNQSGEQMPAP